MKQNWHTNLSRVLAASYISVGVVFLFLAATPETVVADYCESIDREVQKTRKRCDYLGIKLTVPSIAEAFPEEVRELAWCKELWRKQKECHAQRDSIVAETGVIRHPGSEFTMEFTRIRPTLGQGDEIYILKGQDHLKTYKWELTPYSYDVVKIPCTDKYGYLYEFRQTTTWHRPELQRNNSWSSGEFYVERHEQHTKNYIGVYRTSHFNGQFAPPLPRSDNFCSQYRQMHFSK